MKTLAFAASLLLLASASMAQTDRHSDFGSIVDQARREKLALPLEACTLEQLQRDGSLTLRDGAITGSRLIDSIGGYAGSAKTTGGLAGRLVIVTSNQDYDPEIERPIPGSLRSAIDTVTRSGLPAWIMFAAGQKLHIQLRTTLRVPSNVTIDGSCADVSLTAPSSSRTILLYVASGTTNVIITRLSLSKTDYAPELSPNNDSALRLNGNVDRIAVLYNDLFECGDGCLDITVSPHRALPQRSRITVSRNFFHDHDKVMLFGTFDCSGKDGEDCDAAYYDANRHMPPALYLTLDRNLFLRTGQRHPRAWGRVSGHIVNNVVAFKPFPRSSGTLGAAYGIFSADTARILAEQNVFVPLPPLRSPPLAIWTTDTPGAMSMPGSVGGFVRLNRNATYGGALAEEKSPQEVSPPAYEYKTLTLDRLSPAKAINCLARLAGRSGIHSDEALWCSE